MPEIPACQLTTKDLAILEGLLEMLAADPVGNGAMVQLLRHKLTVATISFREDIDPRVATINSRVEFQTDDGPVDTRTLTYGGENALPGATLRVSTLRGLALLGLMEGQTIAIERPDGGVETLRLVRIAHQPEAARRARTDAHLAAAADLDVYSAQARATPAAPARRVIGR